MRLFLCDRRLRQGSIPQRSPENAAGVGRRADVGRARIHRRCPQVFVGQPMSADDAGCRKFTRQIFYIWNGGCFHIQNGNACAVLANAGAHFFQGLDLANRRESVGEGGNERLRYPRIALEEYCITSLWFLPLGTATGLWRRWTESTQSQTLILMSGTTTDVAFTSFRPRFRSGAQTTQPGASRFASAGFPPCPRPVPVPSGK